jgi:conjugative relaxase-like TrwC/TraI family protein
VLNIGRLAPGAADYYVGEVATSAEDYYTGRGESQGRWVGSLAADIGLDGTVEPEAFRAVLDGKNPVTGERLARSRNGCGRRRVADPNQQALFDAELEIGRVATRLKLTVGRVRQLAWAGQEAQRGEKKPRFLVGRKVPRRDGRSPVWVFQRTEVERYEAEHSSRRARPGYDLTLRPPKSVSVLWALAGADERATIRQAHREAVDAVVDHLEQHAVYARRGTKDRGRIEVDGVIAAAFDHRTSRAGDPLLHTHVVTANLTRTAEGRWQAIDGRPLYTNARPAGFVYQAHLRHLLSARLGVEWEPVRNGWAEISGVPQAVVRAFSKRRDEIEEMVAEAGYTSAGAHQAATLATRRAKEYGVDADRLPAALGGAGQVGGDDVGGQERVAGPAGAVVEGGGDDPVDLDPTPVLGAPPGVHSVLLEVLDASVYRLAVRLAHRGALVGTGECPQHADALRGSQREVVAGPSSAGAVLGLVALDLGALEHPHRSPTVRPRDLATHEEPGLPLTLLGLLARPRELANPPNGEPEAGGDPPDVELRVEQRLLVRVGDPTPSASVA